MYIICIVWIVFLGATLAQLMYWGWIFGRFPGHPSSVSERGDDTVEGVSVVICARNEAENLRRNLPHFLAQDHRSVEILVVNDHSEDNTREIVLDFQNKYPILCLVDAPGDKKPGKKTALSEGIYRAQHDNIIVSDADCRPASERWLACMTQSLTSPYEIALGYGPYERRPGFLNTFIRFETIYTAIQYFSFAIIGLPYMGVGRNLAYRRDLFLSQDGFSRHAHVASGDDDLFVNGAARADRIALMLQPDSFVYSDPEETWSGYYHQKKRHLSVGRHYRKKHQWMLGGLSLSHSLHYLLGILLLVIDPNEWPFVLVTFSVRMGVVLWVWAGATRRLREPGILYWVPLLDFAFLIFYFCFAPVLLTRNIISKWK